MLELVSGSIVVDDVDIGTVPLRVLRSRMSVIPQDPVLFSGVCTPRSRTCFLMPLSPTAFVFGVQSLRRNLDPFSLSSDEACWDALEKVRPLSPTRTSAVDALGVRWRNCVRWCCRWTSTGCFGRRRQDCSTKSRKAA